jgi:hypothetical protein
MRVAHMTVYSADRVQQLANLEAQIGRSSAHETKSL